MGIFVKKREAPLCNGASLGVAIYFLKRLLFLDLERSEESVPVSEHQEQN